MRRLLLILSTIFLGWATLVIATRGVQFRIVGVLFRSRDPERALAIGLVLLLIHVFFFRESFTRDTDRVAAAGRRWLPILALGCALWLVVHAVRYGAFTAGGSDSYAYVSQAYAWAGGVLPRAQPIPVSVPWPSADASLAPLGYCPGPQPHTIVPTYAPGLPLMMAAALVLGACGPFLVVPLCAGLVVWQTYRLGHRTSGPWAGMLATALVTVSPIVVFQSMSPMTDVPVAALWTGAAVAALGGTRRSAFATGLWTAAAHLVRPNLPALPLVLLVHLALSVRGRERWIRMALFSVAAVPAAIAIATLYTAWHGSPWNSGFGSAAEIFAAKNILPNLARYPVWLWQSQSPLILLAFVPLLPPFRSDADRPATRLLVALFLATLISYLVYFVFEEWWYLRFLLPAIPALLVLMSTGMVALGRRLPRPWGRVVVIAVTLLLLAHAMRFNVGHGMFGTMKEAEGRYAEVGAYIHEALPRNAVVLSLQHSGSVRFYGGRMTIRWDLIDRDWTARAAGELERLGLRPYMVIEDWELPAMRDRFGFAPDAPVPWPLVARMQSPIGVSVLDLSSNPAQAAPADLAPGRAPRCSAPQPILIRPE